MMDTRLRHIAAAMLFVASAALNCTEVAAQSAARSSPASAYPVKPVRIVDAFPPGGGSDFVARTLAPKLAEAWGQQIVIDNRGGANGIIGNEHVIRSAPDGYTALIVTGSYAANPSVYKLPYDPVNDITVLGQVASTSFVIVVHPALPTKTLKEFIALAKAKPGAINFGSTGTGGSTHLVAEFFKIMAKVDLTHIPYKGTGPAVTDLLGGQIQFMIAASAPVMPHVKSGRLRALAVTGTKRIASAPEVPTAIEAGLPDYDVASWYAIVGPKALPADIVARWNTELRRITQQPDVRDRIASGGMEAVTGTPEEFMAILKRDIERWAKVTKQAGIKQN